MVYGYARVSTVDQNTKKFTTALEEAGAEKIIAEIISGATSWRRRRIYDIAAYSVYNCEKIITPELSRIGRNLVDVLDFIDFARRAGITVQILKEGMTVTPQGNPAADLQLQIMGAVAQFERGRLSERIKEGMAAGRAGGAKYGGYRKRGEKIKQGRRHHPHKEKIVRALRAGGSISTIAARYGVSRMTLYRWADEKNLKVRKSLYHCNLTII